MSAVKRWLIWIGGLLITVLSCGLYVVYQRKKREDAEIATKLAEIRAEQFEVTNEVMQDMRDIDKLYADDPKRRLLAKARYNSALASTIDSGSAASLRAARLAAGLFQP